MLCAALLALCLGAWIAGAAGEDGCDRALDPSCAAPLRTSAAADAASAVRTQQFPRRVHFGFNLGVRPPGAPNLDLGVQALKRVGASHYRTGINWNGCCGPTSPEQPVGPDMRSPRGQATGPALQDLDEQYERLLAEGITPVIIIGDAPRWASTLRRCAEPAWALSHPSLCPPNWRIGVHHVDRPFFAHWREFVAAVGARYPRAVIEAPNEPDNQYRQRNENPGSYPNAVGPDHAAEIQCELFRALPARQFVLSSALSVPEYVKAFVGKAHGCYDAFSFHPYPARHDFDEDSTFGRTVRGLREARELSGDRVPIWVTETAATYIPSRAGQGPTEPEERALAATTLAIYDHLVVMPDVEAVFFHTLRDGPQSNHNDPASHEFYYGFFQTDWTPKLRACPFLAPGSPAIGPCPAVSSLPKAARKPRRCRRVTKRVRRNGKVVRRKVLVCPKKRSPGRATPR